MPLEDSAGIFAQSCHQRRAALPDGPNISGHKDQEKMEMSGIRVSNIPRRIFQTALCFTTKGRRGQGLVKETWETSNGKGKKDRGLTGDTSTGGVTDKTAGAL